MAVQRETGRPGWFTPPNQEFGAVLDLFQDLSASSGNADAQVDPVYSQDSGHQLFWLDAVGNSRGEWRVPRGGWIRVRESDSSTPCPHEEVRETREAVSEGESV